MLPRPLVTGLTVLIALAWAVNVVIGFLYPARHDPSLNAIFAVVVGGVYALGRKRTPETSATRKRLARLIAGDDEPDDEHAEHAEHAGHPTERDGQP